VGLKFGIFDHLERLSDVPLDQQYADRMKQIAKADQAGFHCYHLAEHHHSPLCTAPNQGVFLAAIAQHTQRLLFGPMVYVLPLHHPVRLLEEISMVDNLSGGRFQIGIGPGTGGGQEFLMWGGNPEEHKERFEETFKIIMEGLTHDYLSYKGKYYQFRDLWMELKPKQKPYPPFWYGQNPVHAAQLGANFICFSELGLLSGMVDQYLESWQKQIEENDPSLPHVAEPLYGGCTHLYIADTEAEAVERAKEAYHYYGVHIEFPVPSGAPEHPRLIPKTIHTPGAADFEVVRQWKVVVAGTPDTAREFLDQYSSETNCNYFVGSFQWGNLTHEEASRSMELFISEVMPHFV